MSLTSRLRPRTRRAKDDRGLVAVEVAIIMPLLVLLVSGIIRVWNGMARFSDRVERGLALRRAS